MTSVMLDPTVVPSEATETSQAVNQSNYLHPDPIDLYPESTDHVEISTLSNQGLHIGRKSEDEAPVPETFTTSSKCAILLKREYIIMHYIKIDNFFQKIFAYCSFNT